MSERASMCIVYALLIVSFLVALWGCFQWTGMQGGKRGPTKELGLANTGECVGPE